MCLGVPAEVVAIEPDRPRAVVEIARVRRTISTDLLLDADEAPLAVGDWVLVHVGFALARIDADEAAATLEEIRRLGTLDDEVASFASSHGVL